MKVLHVLSSLCQGGAENYVVDLALAMHRQGIDVAVAYISSAHRLGRTSDHERQVIGRLDEEGIPLFHLGHVTRRWPIFGALRLRRIIRQWRPDIIHGHLLLACLFYALSLSRVRFFYTHHNSRFHLICRIRWLLRWRRISVVAISATQYQQLREHGLRPSSYVYNAVDLSRFRDRRRTLRSEENSRVRKLISVTNLRPVKDIPTLLQGFSLAREALFLRGIKIELDIVGEGPLLHELERVRDRMGLARSVRFLGARDDVPDLLRRSDLFLLSSASEGMPVSLLEALCSSVPAVVTDVGACREVIERSASGIVVPPGNAGALAEAIVTMIGSRELSQSSRTGCQVARSQFSIDTAVMRHMALYEGKVPV